MYINGYFSKSIKKKIALYIETKKCYNEKNNLTSRVILFLIR